MTAFEYKIGDRVILDRTTVEDTEHGAPGFIKHFDDLDKVEGTVYYIRTPWKFMDEEPRTEPTIMISLDAAPQIRSLVFYPDELTLTARGVNPVELTKLSKDLTVVLDKLVQIAHRAKVG